MTDDYNAIADVLHEWHDQHARILPWRHRDNGARNAWHVLLSEFLLQQTTVATIIKRFDMMVAQFPTPADMVQQGRDAVLDAWAGLGYYRRAHYLYDSAVIIAKDHANKVPSSYQELRQLPGVGDYTANAILVFAFNQPYMPLDANIGRITARLLQYNKAPTSRKLHAFSAALFAKHPPDKIAESLMDIGATICHYKNPQCGQCPLQLYCSAHNNDADNIYLYPVKEVKKKRVYHDGLAIIAHDSQKNILLERRHNHAMLHGLVGFPCSDWHRTIATTIDDIDTTIFNDYTLHDEAEIEHHFSHFSVRLRLVTANLRVGYNCKEHEFLWPVATIYEQAMPTLMAKIRDKYSNMTIASNL